MFDERTKVLLINAIHFENRWLKPFCLQNHKSNFYSTPNITKEVSKHFSNFWQISKGRIYQCYRISNILAESQTESEIEFRISNRHSNGRLEASKHASVRVEDSKNSVSNWNVGFEIRRNSKVRQHWYLGISQGPTFSARPRLHQIQPGPGFTIRVPAQHFCWPKMFGPVLAPSNLARAGLYNQPGAGPQHFYPPYHFFTDFLDETRRWMGIS